MNRLLGAGGAALYLLSAMPASAGDINVNMPYIAGPTSGALIVDAGCPPDKPIKRTVSAGMVRCTLAMCVGRLVCPDDPPMLPPGAAKALIGADCYYAAAGNCNTCTADVHEICLSKDELDKAK